MTSKKLNALLDKVLLSPIDMETMAGRLEAARLIRKAYALGRRERGVTVAKGWCVPDILTGARLSPRHQGEGSFKVEVIRVK